MARRFRRTNAQKFQSCSSASDGSALLPFIAVARTPPAFLSTSIRDHSVPRGVPHVSAAPFGASIANGEYHSHD